MENKGYETCWFEELDWTDSNYQTNTSMVGASGVGEYKKILCGGYATLESRSWHDAPGWSDYTYDWMAHPYRGWWP